MAATEEEEEKMKRVSKWKGNSVLGTRGSEDEGLWEKETNDDDMDSGGRE